MAHLAARTLAARIAEPATEPARVVIECHLVERTTTRQVEQAASSSGG